MGMHTMNQGVSSLKKAKILSRLNKLGMLWILQMSYGSDRGESNKDGFFGYPKAM